MEPGDRRRRSAEEAAEWWVLLLGDVSRAQREEYVEWLRESPLHVAEMLRIAQVHGALAQFDRWDRILTSGGADGVSGTVIPLQTGQRTDSPPPNPRGHSPRRFRAVLAIAASLIILAALSGLYQYFAPGQIIQTERGERREVALPDGSVLQIDPETRLRIDYQKDFRRIYLERGRALFHVAKNAQRPFLVKVDDTTVRAVGTSFAVEQGQDDVVVTVAEGKVAVLLAHAPKPSEPGEDSRRSKGSAEIHDAVSSGTAVKSPALSAPRDRISIASSIPATPAVSGSAVAEIFLTANEQVKVENSGTAEPVREVDSRRALAWADGNLIFDNDTVEFAVREFNHYNRIQLTVSDPKLARRTISGVFSAADPESFVAFIHSVAAVRITRDGALDITIDAAN